jgi:hypothetical protein
MRRSKNTTRARVGDARVTEARALAPGSRLWIWLMVAAAAGELRPGVVAERDPALDASA